MRLAVSVDVHRNGLGHAYGIAQLHEHFIGHPGRYHIFCDVACRVGCRAVYLRGVLAREGASSVCPFAAVSVDNDFAAGQSGVAVRAANDEFPCGVNVILDVATREEFLHFGCVQTLLQYAGNENVNDIAAYLVKHHLVGLLL